MAHATTRTIDFKAPDLAVVKYASLGNENGDVFSLPHFPDKTIQATGTGTVTLQGSVNGTNWEPLKDQSGTVISIDSSTDAAALVLENPLFMRAVNTNDTGALIVITCSK